MPINIFYAIYRASYLPINYLTPKQRFNLELVQIKIVKRSYKIVDPASLRPYGLRLARPYFLKAKSK